MYALASKSLSRTLTLIFSVLLLASCGKGDGPVPIAGTPATPLPDQSTCSGINFEDLCEPPTIANFNGGATTIIDNPDMSGINDSDKVAQMQKFPDDPTLLFGGTSLGLGSALDFADGTAFTIKVWSQRDVRLVFKLEAGQPVDQSASREQEQTVSGSGSWEEHCYDFAGSLPTLDVFGIVLIFDNGVAGAADTDPTNWTFYYDDILQVSSCGGGGGPTEPSVAAPTPTEPEANVISLFSDAYTNVAGIDYNPPWGQATVATVVDVAGSNTLKYAGLDFQGMDFSGNPQDVSSMTHLRLDVWTADSTALNVFMISPGPAEAAFALPVTPNTWVTVEVPLTTFAGVDLTNVIQLKFDGNGTVFLDNLYFTISGGPAPTEPTTAAPTPTEPEANVISLFSDAYTNVAGIDYNPPWGQATVATVVDVAGSNTLKYAGLDYQGIDFSGSPQDVSGLTSLHLDFWTADSTALNVFLISSGPAETAYALPVTPNTWVSVDVALTAFAGVDLADVIQLKFDGNGTIFLDNLYFTPAGGGGGPVGDGTFVNGDFETGDFTGWTQTPDGGSITLDTSAQGGRAGTVARLVASGDAGAQDVLLSQVNLVEINSVALSGSDSVTVSVDVFGSLLGAGGVVFIELISRDSGGNETGRSFIGPAPIAPTAAWTTHSATVNVAADVSGGITLQLKSSCGPVVGCGVDASFDNASIVIN